MQPILNLSLSQKVAMTPQLAESIRFLQLSAVELADELKSALESNVMLEEDSSSESSSEASDESAAKPADDVAIDWKQAEAPASEDWGAKAQSANSGDFRAEDRLAAEQSSVHFRMLEQVQLHFDDDRRLDIATAIIDATDDSGYLSQTVEQVVANLSAIRLVLPGEVEAVLHTVQRLDPVGYAARSLGECLRVQLEELREEDKNAHIEIIDLALDIVDSHLNALANMDLDALVRSCGHCEEEVVEAVRLIRGLSPKPAADEHVAHAAIPDVVIDTAQGGWSVRLNNGTLPSIKINTEYERIVEADPTAKALRDQLQDARWLMRSVEMRNDTLMRATRFIFEHQPDFLRQGELGLRPLTLKFVADGIGVHESTISRITTSKYVQTPHGVFSLKTFFPSQLAVADGVASSGAAVKAAIQKLVSHEETGTPLRDVDLAAIFARRGVRIARRTIAKYREALGISSSRERQEQYRRENLIQRKILQPITRLAV
ncbi:MAG: RNA polymerase factor sigma-54 [Oceanococcus sp.]